MEDIQACTVVLTKRVFDLYFCLWSGVLERTVPREMRRSLPAADELPVVLIRPHLQEGIHGNFGAVGQVLDGRLMREADLGSKGGAVQLLALLRKDAGARRRPERMIVVGADLLRLNLLNGHRDVIIGLNLAWQALLIICATNILIPEPVVRQRGLKALIKGVARLCHEVDLPACLADRRL